MENPITKCEVNFDHFFENGLASVSSRLYALESKVKRQVSGTSLDFVRSDLAFAALYSTSW